MIVLNKATESLTFEDMVAFCREGYIEGYQLEYKQDLSSPKGLARQFASFSNSRGGVILIGVAESPKTGKPLKYEGLVYESKLIDRIHQYATNVEPRPLYDVHKTNEINGKVFIIVRVYEGDRTPYYVQNDPNLYERTGNLTDPIGLAGPEATELLVHKKEKLELARNNSLFRSSEIYKSALERSDLERLEFVAKQKAEYLKILQNCKESGEKPPDEPKYITKLGTQVSMLTFTLQPYNPIKELITPRDLKTKINDIRVTSGSRDFPNLNVMPIQDGLMYYKWYENGAVECQQLYSNGLLYYTIDVLAPDPETHVKKIYLANILEKLYTFLSGAMKYYSTVKYRGSLVGAISLNDIKGSKLVRIAMNGYFSGDAWDQNKGIPTMNKYTWNLNTDTSTLEHKDAMLNYVIKTMREIYWSVGYEDINEELIKLFLKQNRIIE